MASFQIVVRDPRTEMVDVVEADVAGEPLQDAGKLVEGAALHGCVGVVPGFIALPVGPFELVLHVEEPESPATADCEDGQLNDEPGQEAKKGNERSGEREDGKVHHAHRVFLTRFGRGKREALPDHEDDEGRGKEED